VPRDSGRTGVAAQANTARRFPPPWTVEELDACFVVRDHNGQALAYVYFEDEPGRRSAAKLLIPDGWNALLIGAVIFGASAFFGALVVHLLK